MLETIAKARLPGTQPRAKDTPGSGLTLQDVLDKQHEEEIRDELIIQQQRDQFDFQMSERTELEREYNSMRDLMVEQMKRDDETLKKYVSMI